MINGNDLDLSQHSAAKRVQKKAVPVQVEFAQKDGICKTLEGKVSYKTGDAIITGVEGERWPIKRNKFDATYEPVAPTKAGENGAYTKKPMVVYALQMSEPFYVTVSWVKDKIEGNQGDWLLQYDEDDYGIVNASIFEKSYGIMRGDG